MQNNLNFFEQEEEKKPNILGNWSFSFKPQSDDLPLRVVCLDTAI